MKRTAIFGLIFGLALAALPATADDKKANVLLQGAMAKETVQGDLKGAIALYQNALKEAGANRALAAKALIHMAECYQKLGDAESSKIYEQIVREYADQKEAVTLARARLGGSSPRETSMSRIYSGQSPFVFEKPSPDGRYFVVGGYGDGLVVHEISSNTDRQLGSDASIQHPCFTPDSRRIVYMGYKDKHPVIRIINVDGTGERTILSSDEYIAMEVSGISADGKMAAVGFNRQDKTWQVGLVSLDTGKITILRDNEWRDTYVGDFSPDGRWLVYQVQVSKDAPDGAIYAVATDRSAQNLLVETHATSSAPHFTPDGSRVVFFTQPRLPHDLWSVRVADGKPLGAAEIARSNVQSLMGFSGDGSLYFSERVSRIGIYVAEVDPATWKMKNAPKEVSNAPRDGVLDQPAWSPDGKRLAFDWTRPRTDDVKIVLHSFDGAPDRELSTHANQSNLLGWSPDGKSLVITNADKGMRLFNTESQREQVIVEKVSGASVVPFPTDGRAVFSTTVDGRPIDMPVSAEITGTIHLMRHDLQTGEERELYHGETRQRFPWPPALSPDGRTLVFGFLGPDAKRQSLLLMPVSGGEPREFFSTEGVSGLAWTQDGKAVLFSKPGEIWVQPIDGGATYSTGIRLNGLSGTPSVHPDGSRIAFAGSTSSMQVWTIKNLFPETSSAK